MINKASLPSISVVCVATGYIRAVPSFIESAVVVVVAADVPVAVTSVIPIFVLIVV